MNRETDWHIKDTMQTDLSWKKCIDTYLIMFTNTYFIQETLDMFYLIISYLPISERMKDRYTKIWTLIKIKTEHLLGTWGKNMSKYNEVGR